MNWVLAVLLCAAIVELVLRLPFASPFKALRHSAHRAIWVLSSNTVSDHWKERAMGAYARSTFISSIRLALLLGLAIGAAICIALIFERLSHGFEAFIISWPGLVFSVVAASVYLYARRVAVRG